MARKIRGGRLSILSNASWDLADRALVLMHKDPALAAAVEAQVTGFYAAHPNLTRNAFGSAFLASLIVERLHPAISKVAPTQTQKAA